MKRTLFISILIFALAITSLAGCGQEKSEGFQEKEETFLETTIKVDKKGRIVENVVESFDKDYYDEDEIRGIYESAVAEYDSSTGKKDALLKKLKVDDGLIYITLEFSSYVPYKAIQNEDFFYGTVKEASEAGYSFDVTLKGYDNGDKISKVGIMGMLDRKIVIFSESARVEVDGTIAYVSANVDQISQKAARLSSEAGGGLAYLILN